MTEKIPRTVPLPYVADYTDDIVLGNLGLPVGFDDERLLVNLRGINHIRRLAGLGKTSIVGERGDTTSYDYDITSFDTSGTATFGAKSKINRVNLVSEGVKFPTASTLYGKPEVTIKLNSAEIDERIRLHHGTNGLFEAKPRAKLLNSAVQNGLASAAIDANLDWKKITNSATIYGYFMVMGLFDHDFERTMLGGAVFAPVGFNAVILQESILLFGLK